MKPMLTTEQAAKHLHIARSSYHRLANDGLLLTPFKTTPNRSMLFEYEIDELVQARAAGAIDDEIRALVLDLLERRNADIKKLKSAENINKKALN